MTQRELELLKKYLQKNTTPDESRQVRQILSKAEDDEDVKQLLLKEWRNTSFQNEADIEVSTMWQEFRHRVLFDDLVKSRSLSHPSKARYYIAASIVFVLISTFVLFFFSKNNPQNPSEDEITFSVKQTGKGEKLNITLPDGSFIKLNSSTSLRIPSNYSASDERVVYLQGEAFFDIAKYEGKPFKVISGEITTQVLGTAFDINTSPNNDEISVAVVRGRVRVANRNSQVILDPNEMTTLTPETEKPAKGSFDVELVTGWRDNMLVFKEVSFDEIIEKLRQWYGVEFEISGKPSSTGKYSGKFKNRSLPLVLEGLGFSSEFDYKIVDKTVYLKFK